MAAFDVAEVRDAASQLIDYGRRMIDDGLAVGTSGNLSVLVGDVVAITPSSVKYADVEVDDICVVAQDGAKLAGQGAVSSEWPMHSGVYRTTDARAVVHTHSPEVVALSLSCEELPAVHYAIHSLGGPIRVVPYVRFGSSSLADGAIAALKSRTAVILQNHGGLTFGSSLAQAYERAQLLEWLAGVYRRALDYGTPRILTAGELSEVADEVARRRYGSSPDRGKS